MSWVVIPNWGKFQHYSDRRPVWIKDYPDQLDRDEYRALSPTARALLQDVRRLYALCDGVCRIDGAATRLGIRLRREHWKELTDAGFIKVVASKPLALTRVAREEETEKDLPKKVSKQKPAGGRKVTGWRIVRGSHSMTTIPDPFGTDPPPTLTREMP